MFTIIMAKDNKRKLFIKRAIVSYVKQDMLSYSVIELKNSKLINHKRIQRLIGKLHVVMTDEVKQVCRKEINPIDDKIYSYKLMQNGINRILQLSMPIDRTKSVILVDIHSRYQSLADVLLKYFNTVRIITNRQELYQHYVTSRLYDFGATVMLSEKFKMTADTVLVVSPDGIIFNEMNGSAIPVITPKPTKAELLVSVNSFRGETPTQYKHYMPNGVDEHEYQAALYEYCGIRGLATLCPNIVTVNNTVQNVDELKINLFSIDIK